MNIVFDIFWRTIMTNNLQAVTNTYTYNMHRFNFNFLQGNLSTGAFAF